MCVEARSQCTCCNAKGLVRQMRQRAWPHGWPRVRLLPVVVVKAVGRAARAEAAAAAQRVALRCGPRVRPAHQDGTQDEEAQQGRPAQHCAGPGHDACAVLSASSVSRLSDNNGGRAAHATPPLCRHRSTGPALVRGAEN